MQRTKLPLVAAGIIGGIAVIGLSVAIVTHDTQPGSTNLDAPSSKEDVKAVPQTQTQGDTMNLESTDITVGTGAEATTGSTVSVHYTGALTDGTKFDSSLDRGTPFSFPLGAGQVIKGWDEGVVGMKVGGKRKLVIPPSLGYGDRAVSTIPANSTLVFEVELLEVK